MDADQKFMAFVQEWARAQNCTFEVENFDGREPPEPIDGMAVDDVWGWLLPEGVTKPDDDYFGCVEWSEEDGKVHLKWVTYD